MDSRRGPSNAGSPARNTPQGEPCGAWTLQLVRSQALSPVMSTPPYTRRRHSLTGARVRTGSEMITKIAEIQPVEHARINTSHILPTQPILEVHSLASRRIFLAEKY